MKKEDVIRKLTSRKFWLTVTAFVTMLIVYFGGSQAEAEQVAALIMAGAAIVAYVLAEGFTDAKHTNDTDSVYLEGTIEETKE